MDIDIYQQCPCHSGKKIKFCCGKDIVSELNQIVAKSNSNQSLSALDQIERTIAKHGEKDCLLTLQTHILFSLGEIEKASESNKKFVDRKPDHPVGRQHEAMTLLAEGHVMDSIAKLQDAMDLVKDNEIPLPMANAFRMLGAVLLNAGHLIAARAHLQFALMIRGEAVEELQQLLQQSFRMPGAPLILKTDYRVEPPPEGKEWTGKYQNVVRALNRGQFRLALRILERIDENWPDQKEVVRSIAVVHSMLANEEQMSAAWHRSAALPDAPNWQAVEHEALSQIFMDDEPSGILNVVTNEFTISDLDSVFQFASNSARLVASQCPEENPFGEGPAPRYSYYLLDREKIEVISDLVADDVPLIIGEVLLYGKQTDRAAQLLFFATRKDGYENSLEFLRESFSEYLSGSGKEEVVSTTSVAADVLTWNWHVPADTSVERHRALIADYRRSVLLDKWPEISFSCLDSLTPNQAAQRPELAIALAALILNLEQSAALQMAGEDDISEVKRKLRIAQPEKLDASRLEGELLTPLRIRQIDPVTFSDEQLERVYLDSVTIGNTCVLKQIVPEILSRQSLAEKIPRDICYSMLAQLTDNNELAIEYLQKARHEAKSAGRGSGLLLVQEFEIRLSRGITDKLPELLQTIQKQYLSDPNVEYQLARVLTKFGLLSPDGRSVSLPSSPEPEESSDSESKIWTPDSGEPNTAEAGRTENPSSKIWVPGSD